MEEMSRVYEKMGASYTSGRGIASLATKVNNCIEDYDLAL